MKKKVVITGPTGAVGMALIQKCVEEDWEVLAICHKGSKRNHQIPQSPNISILELDMEELGNIDLSKYRDYNIWYHLAWGNTYGAGRDNMTVQIQNIAATVKAAEMAALMGCDTFVGVGSQAEYGRVEGVLLPMTPTYPESGYGMAKLCAGQMSRVVCEQHGMKHVWVRILSVYGPYDRAETMVSSSLRHMLHGEETQFTPAEQMWDFLYSGDAAEALYRIGCSPVHGRIYCLGSGQALPLREYIAKMKKITGCQAKTVLGAVPYAKNQVMHLCADISRLTEDTGFVPETDFETGIEKTIDWIKEYEEN